jgi:hypothetical protein
LGSVSMFSRVAEVLGATVQVKIQWKTDTNRYAVAEDGAKYGE